MTAPALDPWLLSILVCPVTRTKLRYDAERQELVSDAAGLAYPIRDGVPVLLAEEARRFGDGGAGGAVCGSSAR